jgi:SAM-dependent methyltransferase
MTQTCTETTSPTPARSGFAWFSDAIPQLIRPAGRDGSPAEAPRCSADPIFGHARPIMGQQPNTAAAASVNPSLTGRVNFSFRTAPASKTAPHASRQLPRLEPSRSLSGGWPLPKNAGRTERTTLRIRANRANLADESISMRTSAALSRTTPSALHDAAPRATSAAAALHALQAQLKLPSGEAMDSLLKVHDILAAQLPDGVVEVYEAGGGSISFLPSDVLRRSQITVVDIDEEQLRNNGYAQNAILGDIQTHRFTPNSFDLVNCYNVIEHLPDVEAALTGFFHALKPGGLVLIAAPNPKSLSGVVTKYTPHWFHVWFYRYVRGEKNAGLPGHAPFPTHFHPLVTLSKLEAFARAQGLQVIYRKEYESPRFPEMRARKPVLAALLDTFAAAMNRLLPGKADVRHGDYHVILRKR